MKDLGRRNSYGGSLHGKRSGCWLGDGWEKQAGGRKLEGFLDKIEISVSISNAVQMYMKRKRRVTKQQAD